MTEDDWSFVIKTHALIESALTRLIEITVRPNSLGEFVTTFDLTGGRHSKVELLRRCDLIDNSEAKFVRGLSKIRNRLVHNVRYTGCELAKFVRDHLSENDKDDFVKNTCCLFTEDKGHLTRGSQIRADVLTTPKPFIWLSALHVTAMATSRTQIAESKAKIDRLERENAEREAEILKKKLEQVLATTNSFFLAKVDGLSIFKALQSKKEETQGQTATKQKTGEK